MECPINSITVARVFLIIFVLVTYFINIQCFTANQGNNKSDQPRAMQLSPVKLAKQPETASMLQLKALKRLPHICPWCLRWVKGSLKDHLLTKVHKKHMHIKKLREMKSRSETEYLAECSRLNLVGRGRNNVRAIEKGDRQIVPARRTKNTSLNHTSTMVWCSLCSRLVTKKAYRESHLLVCAKEKQLRMSNALMKELAKNAEPVVEPEEVAINRLLAKEELPFKEVLFYMRSDRLALTEFATTDSVARALVSRMISNGQGKNNWVTPIRMRLRLLFDVFRYFKKIYGVRCKTMMDVMRYPLWHATSTEGPYPVLISCCHSICQRNPEDNTFKKFNEVMNLSGTLQQMADIVVNQIHHAEDEWGYWMDQGKSFTNFSTSETWKLFTVRPAARQKALMVNFKKQMVPPEDFKFYLDLVEETTNNCYLTLLKAWNAKDYHACVAAHQALIEVLPIAIGAYSYRRVSEPFNFKTDDHLGRADMQKLLADHNNIIEPGAIVEILKVFVLETRGKGDNPVLTIIKCSMLPMLDLLCDIVYRRFLKIPERNKLIFASVRSRNAMGHANPSKCQAKFAKMCEGYVTNIKLLRSRHFRMTFATNLCSMNLTYNTKKLMCALMGHKLGVHELHYNIPQPLQLAAYMGFACQASAENKIVDMRTTSIEDQLKLQKGVDTTGIPLEDDM